VNAPGGPSGPADAPRPALRIVRGRPTPEELAALTVLVGTAAAGPPAAPAAPLRGRWSDPAQQHARLPAPGPGAWAASFR
jgi:hypothetical protein